MLQCWQEGLSHVFSAPLGASGYLLSTWTWHEILWSESDELSYLAGNYPRKMSVGWVCWSEWPPSHALMRRCRSRIVSVAGNPHLNVLWVAGKMLVHSLMWAEMQALHERRAGHEGRSRWEQRRGMRGFWKDSKEGGLELDALWWLVRNSGQMNEETKLSKGKHFCTNTNYQGKNPNLGRKSPVVSGELRL